MRIVINGIGVAGPALAFWLNKAGHEVLLVEEARDFVFRNLVTHLMRVHFVADLAIGRALRDDIALPQYDLPSL